LKSNGTVVFAGDNTQGQGNVSDWKDIVAVSAGTNHSIGLKMNGKVVATKFLGDNYCGQCEVSNWSDIIAVSAGGTHTLGLKSDGKVVAVGDSKLNQCAVSSWKLFDDFANFETERIDIINNEEQINQNSETEYYNQKYNSFKKTFDIIQTGSHHTVALLSNGRVLSAGHNNLGQCSTTDWREIVSISANSTISLGLKSDGTVLVAGRPLSKDSDISGVKYWKNIKNIFVGYNHVAAINAYGNCFALGDNKFGQCNIISWRNIVSLALGYRHTVGLKSDGTVVSCGENGAGECNVTSWKNIKAVAVSSTHTVGIRNDGTVVATGNNQYGQCNLQSWENVVDIKAGLFNTVGLTSEGHVLIAGLNQSLQSDLDNWQDIIAISVSSGFSPCPGKVSIHIVGVKIDGTLLAIGDNNFKQCDVSSWKLFDDLQNIDEERKIKLQIEQKEHEDLVKQTQIKAKELARQKEAQKAQLDLLQSKYNKLVDEKNNLKGLFTKSRKKEIDSELLALKQKIDALSN
jgi:alpha-tubulin suppressor-like RCC1 family protein